jgi:transcription elongation factor Elf1
MLRRLWSAFLSNPLEIPLALALLGLGFALAQSHGWQGVAGNALIALGGVLFSWTAATTFAGEHAVREIRARLDGVTRQLGTVSGQIGRAAAQAEAQALDADTAFAVIAQATGNLYGLVNEMQLILGEPFRTEELIGTAETLEGLAWRLGELSSRASEDSPVEDEELQSLRLQLEAVQKELSQPRRALSGLESAECPSCGNATSVQIGDLPGSSALTTCERCGTRFHIHRGRDLAIFTKAWGSGPGRASGELTAECPRCKGVVTMRTWEGEHGTRQRFCMTCFARLTIDLDAEEVVVATEESPLEGVIYGQSGTKSVIRCSVCGAQSVAFFKRDNAVYAECETCNRLLRAVSSG